MKTPEQREQERAYHREWRRRNPERLLAYRRKRDPEKLAAYNRELYARDREKIIARSKAWTESHPGRKWAQDLKKYGLTVADWNRLFELQNGVCAICGKPETAIIRGKLCRLAVDHDHRTGRVRRLLCASCNMLIGQARHDPVVLRLAADYCEREKALDDVEHLEFVSG